MKFSPKCRTKKYGMIYTILESFCSFLNWEGADIWPKIRPRKIPESYHSEVFGGNHRLKIIIIADL